MNRIASKGMNKKSKWLCAISLSLGLFFFGLFLYGNLFRQAESPVNDFDLNYEQGFINGYCQGRISYIESPDNINHAEREAVREIEIIKEAAVDKPVELREFTSLEELEMWLAEDDTDEYIHLVAGEEGVCRQSDKYDCDDYALQLQHRAVKSGFLMSATIIEKQGEPHMINLTCIGNDIYYIEPQADEVWFYCHRD